MIQFLFSYRSISYLENALVVSELAIKSMEIQSDDIKSQAGNQRQESFNRLINRHPQNIMEQQIPAKRNSAGNQENNNEKVYCVKKIQDQFNFIDNGSIVYLDKKILNTIVQLCRAEGLISEDLAHIFFNNHTVTLDRKYIDLFNKNKLQQYDFLKAKINIIDHRRLVEMLIKHKPQKYKIFKPQYTVYDFDKTVRQFLEDIWNKSGQYYYTLLDWQVKEYYQSWWGGPERIKPVVDPPLKFYESQEGKKIRQSRQNTIRIESQQQQRDRNKRISQQRSTNVDLQDIARLMTAKLYGKPKDTAEIKKQATEDSKEHFKGSSQSKSSKKTKRKEKVKEQQEESREEKKKKSKSKQKKEKKSKGLKQRAQAKMQQQ